MAENPASHGAAMLHFRRKPDEPKRTGLLEDIERIWRRTRAILLVAPVLLLVGFSTGHFTNRVLGMPENMVARSTALYMPGFRLETIGLRMREVRDAGEQASATVDMYREHIAPVERVLKRRGVPASTARRVAWPLVEQTKRNRLDVATVMSIVFVESNVRPDATSSVGARRSSPLCWRRYSARMFVPLQRLDSMS
jgi:soluble lytic murein transglycosylase-like protein